MKPLFIKGPSLGVRFLALTVLSIALMVVDARFSALKPLRSQLGMALMPLYYVAELPVRAWDTIYLQLTSRADLIAENESLRAEALLTKRKLQKLAALTEQNVRLRELLNSSELVDERVLVAELIGVDPNAFTQRILIDKGERDGVFLGQPVLDATGLMGQVVEVLPFSARVLLITDSSHSLPVQINRNGLRAIASGTGSSDWLELRHVGDTADIRVNDIVVSSGLGQRFPAGYPVGRVAAVDRDSSQPFAEVRVEPTAQLNRSRYLLLVFSAESGYGDVLPALSLDSEAVEADAGDDVAPTDAPPPSETPPAAPAAEEQNDAQ
ncbi:rod shape-determining protein MreC [Pseudomonas sp. G11-1]|nr:MULTISPECIES: rod shape-determining protein MreC [Halopseudomonas]MCO5787392.1 rod shape-determining protein MreC [Pseudomonas sp. G11-1]MCO5790617.1 rod shape-determining protein MreC [Pseudomonas sp. G11-2]WGK63212.1 rod shape-determining protein MreC [Halopseudomonas sp. SMJS2]